MRLRGTALLIGCIISILSLSACGGGSGGGSDPSPGPAAGPKQDQDTITGKVSGAASVLPISTRFDPGNPLFKAPVGAGGVFDAYAWDDKPAALLFLDGNDRRIANLQFFSGASNGMTSIPLENTRPGGTVDLGTLSLSGQTAIPGRDPFTDGDLSSLSQAEIRVLRLSGAAFSSVAVNPDADGNGKIDVLEGKFYLPYMSYVMDGSFSGGSLTGSVAVPATGAFDHFELCFQDQSNSPKPSSGVNFTGPAGSGLNNSPQKLPADSASGKYCSPNMSPAGGSPVIAGVYTAAYNGATLTFVLPDQSTAGQDILIIVPKVTLNGDGTVSTISWTYRLGDGSNGGAGDINPANLLTGLRIYMSNKTGNNRYYDSANDNGGAPFGPTMTAVSVKQTVQWSNVSLMEIDLYTMYGGCFIFYFTVA